MTYAKGVLKTLMFTYPFALVALELPQMDISSFESCSRRACTFMQVFGKGLAPQEESCAKLGFVKAFHVIVNGRHSPTCDEDYFLEPICPSYSEKQMVDKCETLEVRESIINPLKSSWLQYGYAACIVGWAISSLLHDLLLMQDKNEFLTLRLGCVSALFQLLALMAGFFWSQDVLKVFASEVIPGVCACFFVLPEIRAILAIMTPCLLYKECVGKLQQLHRAILVGDHLYFQAYNVPFALARDSQAVNPGTFVVGTARGFYQEDKNDERLTFAQCCWLARLQRLLLLIFLGPVSLSIALATGPAAVRILQFASNEQLPWHLEIIIILCLCCFPCYLFFRLLAFCPCNFQGDLQPGAWESHPHRNLLGRLSLLVLVVVGLLWSTAVLSYELLSEMRPTTAEHALLTSEAGVLYFTLGVQLYVWVVELRSTFQAVQIKAHKLYPPSVYIEVAQSNPEFQLDAELSLAQEFLQDLDTGEPRWERWQAKLASPSTSEESSSDDLR